MLNTNSPAKTTEITGNGKLTAELFEATSVAVGGRPAPAVTSKVGVHQPSKAEIIRRGEEAMTRLAEGRSWSDWVAVMRVLDIARTTAMLEAGTNKPQGPRYREAFRKWLRLHPAFEAIDKSDRSRFHKCFDNLDAINDWREKHVLPQQLLKLNYPTQVLSRWESWKKKQSKTEESGGHEPSSDPSPGPKLADVWAVSSQQEKQEVLDREGRVGLAEIVSPSLLAELGDHAIAQQINSTPSLNVDSKSTDVRVVLTKIFRQIAGAPTPEARSNAVAAFMRKYEANHLDYRDLLITFPKKRAPKKR